MTLKAIVNSTEGATLFMLSVVATSLSCQILWSWWVALIGLAIGGYIGLAQLTIILYFESDSDDPWLKRTVLLYVVGYAALCSISFHRGNEQAAFGCISGLIAFLTSLLKLVFTGEKPTLPTVTIPPKEQQ